MTYFMSILMGIIQGVAEFLPISSSGHLALFQTFFGMENMEEKYMFFTVLLHFGTLISVCMVYWRDIVDMIREFFLGIAALAGRKDTGVAPPPARRMVMLIIIATVPLFVMVFLQDAVNQLFSNSIMVSCALLATGFILFFSDRMARGHKTAKNATVADAWNLIDGDQIMAACGLDRKFAVRFSFLMSLPAVLGANVLEIKDALASNFPIEELPMYLVGVAVSAVVGYFAIRLVKSLSDKGKFGKFAYYCWAVGLGSLVAGIVKMMLLK